MDNENVCRFHFRAGSSRFRGREKYFIHNSALDSFVVNTYPLI